MKLLQTEEISQESLTKPPTTQSMVYQQPQSTTLAGTSMITTATTTKVPNEKTETLEMLASIPVSQTSSQGSSKIYDDFTEVIQHAETSISSGLIDHEESPEVNEEMAEINYELSATPETNYELPELVQEETPESNQEFPEKSEEFSITENSFSKTSKDEILQHDDVSQQQSIQISSVTKAMDSQKKKEPTVDSVVDEIYGIVKTSTSPFSEESDIIDESKSTTGILIEKMETIEDEEEETR